MPRRLRQDVMGNFAGNIGEAVLASLKLERQLFVVDTQQMQQRRVNVGG